MVKLDYDRDYYADLEVAPTADAEDIKRAFRRLALQWHPDRNRGRENEAKARFVIIQSAHEILVDSSRRAKYDAERRSRAIRFPTASGVKGNPWQNVSGQYPPPPKRPPTAKRSPMSAAAKYSGWVPATSNSARPENDHLKNAERTWERMRNQRASPGHQNTCNQGNTRPQRMARPEPHPTPRSKSQREKAEASFGARRTGFVPTSSTGDEPPFTSKNYATTKMHTAPPYDKPPSCTNESRQAASSTGLDDHAFTDQRQSTPYTTHIGEKTNLFEGSGRAKSMRGPGIRFAGGEKETERDSSTPRPRSASVKTDLAPNGAARSSGPEHGTKFRDHPFASAPNSAAVGQANGSAPTAHTRREDGTCHTAAAFVSTKTTDGLAKTNPGPAAKKEPSVYATPLRPKVFSAHPSPYEAMGGARRLHSSYANEGGAQWSLNFLEAHLDTVMRGLVEEKNSERTRKKHPSAGVSADHKKWTNILSESSFSFSVNDDMFESTAHPARFARHGTEKANVQFTASDSSLHGYQFSAGGPVEQDDAFTAARRMAQKLQRQSPLKRFFSGSYALPRSAANRAQASSSDPGEPSQHAQPQSQATDEQKPTGFQAEQWIGIGPHHFVPPRRAAKSNSPSRKMRKARPARPTAGGTASMVDEDDSSAASDEGFMNPPTGEGAWLHGGKSPSSSPNAMDIDTPPPAETPTAKAEVRNLPVEPSGPEWRAGDMSGFHTAGPVRDDAGAVHHLDPLRPNPLGSASTGAKASDAHSSHVGGSEDSEDFATASFGDFTKVEPFAPTFSSDKSNGSISGSFADLTFSLPFGSKAAPRIPADMRKNRPDTAQSKRGLEFPQHPKAPPPPTVVATSRLKASTDVWDKYVRDWVRYMEDWSRFNGRIVDHFQARRKVVQVNGYDWIETRVSTGIDSYLGWLAEDKGVRQQWMAACEQHDLEVRQFQKMRERMMS